MSREARAGARAWRVTRRCGGEWRWEENPKNRAGKGE